jgi:hypothetical protein
MYSDIAPPTFVVFAAPYAAFTTTSPHAPRFGQRGIARSLSGEGLLQLRDGVEHRLESEHPRRNAELVGQLRDRLLRRAHQRDRVTPELRWIWRDRGHGH